MAVKMHHDFDTFVAKELGTLCLCVEHFFNGALLAGAGYDKNQLLYISFYWPQQTRWCCGEANLDRIEVIVVKDEYPKLHVSLADPDVMAKIDDWKSKLPGLKSAN